MVFLQTNQRTRKISKDAFSSFDNTENMVRIVQASDTSSSVKHVPDNSVVVLGCLAAETSFGIRFQICTS